MAHVETIDVQFHGHAHWKVHAVDLHATQPWMVASDERGGAAIWDIRANTVLAQFSLLQIADEDRDIAVLRSERNPQTYVPPKITKMGNVFCAKFLDREVAQEVGATGFISGRWIFLASTNHAAVIEWTTGKIQHVRTELLDGKPSSSACVIPVSGCVAVGGSDGMIRIWSIARAAIVSKLSGVHTKAVTGIAVHGWTMISGAADGTVCFWDLKREGPLHVNTVGKPHSAVTAVAASTKGWFVSAGSDKQAIVWTEQGKEHHRVKLPVKPWAAAAMPDGWFVVSGKEGSVYKVTSGSEGIALFSNTTLLSRGAKSAKTYALATHVAAPRVACGTNLGAAIIGVADLRAPAVGVDISVRQQPLNSTLYLSKNRTLMRLHLPDGQPEVVAPLTAENPSVVSVGLNARGVAVVWAAQRRGTVFDASSWKAVYDGDCSAAAWSTIALLRGGAVSVHEVRDGMLREAAKIVLETPATALHGGPMLGVVTKSLQFYTWQGQPAGTQMPAARAVCFDAQHDRVALACSDRVVICTLQPFQVDCSVRVPGVGTMLWYAGSLFMAGDYGVMVTFPGKERTLVATLGTASAPPTNDQWSDGGAALCTPVPLPATSWVPVAVLKGQLFVADRAGTVRTIPLSSPVLRFLLLECAGQPKAAAKWAGMIRPEMLSTLAIFMATRGDGETALQLPLKAAARLRVALDARQFETAAEILKDCQEYHDAHVLCQAVATEAARHENISAAAQALDILRKIDEKRAIAAAANIGGQVAMEAAQRWSIQAF